MILRAEGLTLLRTRDFKGAPFFSTLKATSTTGTEKCKDEAENLQFAEDVLQSLRVDFELR